MKKSVVLRIFKTGTHGEQLQGVKQFTDAQIIIGRPGEVQLALEGDAVSLIHASIEDRAGEYYICDLGSVTGTYKNGKQVLDEKVENGDTLQIGDYKIEFFIGAPKPKAAEAVQVAQPPSQNSAPITPPPINRTQPITPSRPDVPAKPASPPVQAPPKAMPSAPSVGGLSAVPTSVPSAKPLKSGPAAAGKRSGRKRKTFAPVGKYSDARDFVKPSKGTIVEVLVAWKDRVIQSHHYSQAKTVTIGSHPSNDIVLPVFSSRVRRQPILKIDKQAVVLLSPDQQQARGELIRGQTTSTFTDLMRQNRLGKDGKFSTVTLEQGEMARLELGDGIAVLIRYVSDSPKPLVAPLLDLTATETTGMVLAIALVATLYLFMYLYHPPQDLAGEDTSEPARSAMIVLTPPTPPPLPSPPPKAPAPPEPQPVAKATPVKVKVADKNQAASKKQDTSTNLTTKNDPGKSAAAAPNKNKTGPRIQTSVKQGGAIKTSKTEGAQMQSKNRDVSKAGVFSVFGNNGAQDQLAQSTTGAGELAGMAGAATGKAGSAVDRAGKGLGSELKDTGMGGNGKSLEGIAGGVGTQGRGSGNSGYGTGGLGNRQGVKIVTGGSGEEITGSIDKEGIRRVVREHYRILRACYEKELNRQPDLFGKIVLTWEIGEQGRVISAHVKSNEIGNDRLASCVVESLKTWRFPTPPANQIAEVSFPFVFSN